MKEEESKFFTTSKVSLYRFRKKKEYQPKRFQIFCPRVMFLLNQV